ncbi:MAG: TRAP transporter TatT component family protein [Gammaproteobacteria bacterium]
MLRKVNHRLVWVGVLSALFLGGCGSIIDNAVDGVATNLTRSMMDQDDPETVRQAAPAYLLMLDSFVQGDPDNPAMLYNTAALYSAYGSVFVDDPVRAQKLTARAWGYAQHALCVEYPQGCDIRSISFDDWNAFLADRGPKDAEALFGVATSWLTFVQSNASDYAVLAQLPKAEALLNRLGDINDGYEEGNITLYLGVLNSIRPAALGGNPEKGQAYFERAIELSEGTDLSAKVSYARFYARTLYERELHDKLLNEVLAADPRLGASTLLNVMAQDEAKRLLESAEEYF